MAPGSLAVTTKNVEGVAGSQGHKDAESVPETESFSIADTQSASVYNAESLPNTESPNTPETQYAFGYNALGPSDEDASDETHVTGASDDDVSLTETESPPRSEQRSDDDNDDYDSDATQVDFVRDPLLGQLTTCAVCGIWV